VTNAAAQQNWTPSKAHGTSQNVLHLAYRAFRVGGEEGDRGGVSGVGEGDQGATASRRQEEHVDVDVAGHTAHHGTCAEPLPQQR
jgi:hypothetical protein